MAGQDCGVPATSWLLRRNESTGIVIAIPRAGLVRLVVLARAALFFAVVDQLGQVVSQFLAIDYAVDEAVLEQELGPLESVG